jgi:hypothetical protein
MCNFQVYNVREKSILCEMGIYCRGLRGEMEGIHLPLIDSMANTYNGRFTFTRLVRTLPLFPVGCAKVSIE